MGGFRNFGKGFLCIKVCVWGGGGGGVRFVDIILCFYAPNIVKVEGGLFALCLSVHPSVGTKIKLGILNSINRFLIF